MAIRMGEEREDFLPRSKLLFGFETVSIGEIQNCSAPESHGATADAQRKPREGKHVVAEIKGRIDTDAAAIDTAAKRLREDFRGEATS